MDLPGSKAGKSIFFKKVSCGKLAFSEVHLSSNKPVVSQTVNSLSQTTSHIIGVLLYDWFETKLSIHIRVNELK